MASTLYMSRSPAVRYASGAALYFAQGIPKGLLHIAMPAWLASQGASSGAIASYLAIIVLPWAFKLVTGPLMDRFAYRPMGSRRPWVLGAQFGLVLSLLSLAVIDDPMAQIGLLTALGVVINSFTATQDVAVDGMAIDLVPESEHGRINAFMSCGKAVGWAVTAALSGTLLVKYGLAVTGVVAAAGAGLVLIAFFFVREREGERLLPWTQGEAVGQRSVASSFKSVAQDLNAVLWGRTSLVVSLIMFFDGVVTGYGEALMPIAAVKLFSFTTAQWSQLVAVMGLTGAFAALALGPLIDRFGARTMLLLTIGVVCVHAFLLAGTQQLWTNSTYVLFMLSAYVLMQPVTMVCVIALAMSICSTRISATQFAVYMSMANLGHSAGSKTFGSLSEYTSFVQNYALLGAIAIMLFGITAIFRKHPVAVPADALEPPTGRP
ncbi:MAG: MFS transporter [Gammaproteobacteria bacterium]|nr:MFS transporter [Gammaproteobacteria bacterium]MDH4310050.1 MFS transporter [Gammaproteobacteria bacterium]MDH5272698.1 MFS transporter [Gammaproteobacteria bacterium]